MSKKKYVNHNFSSVKMTENIEMAEQIKPAECEADNDLEPDTNAVEIDPSYAVKVSIDFLNIRKGPGMNYDKTGKYTGIGIFTIVETCDGEGSETGWGRLESGAGWICLDFTERV